MNVVRNWGSPVTGLRSRPAARPSAPAIQATTAGEETSAPVTTRSSSPTDPVAWRTCSAWRTEPAPGGSSRTGSVSTWMNGSAAQPSSMGPRSLYSRYSIDLSGVRSSRSICE